LSNSNYLTSENYSRAWLILAPFAAYFLVFAGLPTGYALVLGFVDWVGVNGSPKFNGLANYVVFFSDPSYLKALWNTVFIGCLVMAVNVSVGLVGAFLINTDFRCAKAFRVIWYLPAITSTIAVSQVFSLFLNPSGGIVNNILESVGKEPIAWSYSYSWEVFWIVVYTCWRGIGMAMILWLAGLQSIGGEIYEQAEIDGASKLRIFFSITIPMLKPISLYVLITQFVSAIQIFEPVMFISKAAPFGETHVLTTRVFQDFYGDLNFGMAGSSAMVMTVLVGLFTLGAMRWYKASAGQEE
jgi:multiple sugar transport system permease protein